MTHHAIDLSAISAREAYKLMIGTIVPRPIAWVTTVSTDGVANAAPYSFFNCLSADPPLVVLGCENRPDRSFKDTTANIRMTGEFTVNIVDHACAGAMADTAAGLAPEVDEIAAAGLTALPGMAVGCPRIAEAPVSFECRRTMVLSVSATREIVLGEILMAHVREGVVDPETFYTDAAALDAIGRMGGSGYTLTRDRFDLATPSAEDVLARAAAREGGST